LADRLDRSSLVSNTQSDQITQNIMNAIDFQVGGTSHHWATKAAGTAKMIDLIPVFTAKSANDPRMAGPLSTTRQNSAPAFDQGRIISLKLWAGAMSAFYLPQQTTPGEIVPRQALLFQPDPLVAGY